MTEARASPRLVVRESNGTEDKAGFRLFWELGEGRPPFPALEFAFPPFETVEEAVAYGKKVYGKTAETPS